MRYRKELNANRPTMVANTSVARSQTGGCQIRPTTSTTSATPAHDNRNMRDGSSTTAPSDDSGIEPSIPDIGARLAQGFRLLTIHASMTPRAAERSGNTV